MAKSSLVYMGEGKMALSGKWGIAIIACLAAMAITLIPLFIQSIVQIYPAISDSFSDHTSSFLVMSMIFPPLTVVWSFCVGMPIMYASMIGLRQMHTSNEIPMDVMFDKFKQNGKRYLKLGIKVLLKILRVIAIPLVLYIISIAKSFSDFDNPAASSQFGGMSDLFKLAIIIVYLYKYFEFTFVPFVHNDNPEMTDQEIINKSSVLSKGYKWTMFKIVLRAILPAVLIAIALSIAATLFGFIILGTVLFTSFSSITPSFVFALFASLVLFECLISAYVQVRITLPLSVLYSELTGNNEKEKENAPQTDVPPVLLPDEVSNTATEETAKEEEKKAEPEIPYEQRYMPKSVANPEPEEPTNSEDKKDDSDLPYEQRYMPK